MPDLPAGTMFGGYRILSRIGIGGMATVYQAFQLSLGRMVAIKVLPPSGNAEFPARFRREAAIIARLSHPNIVPVYDFGDVDGTLFIAMMYVPRGTLRDRIGTPMPVREAAHYVSAIATALDHAHRQGFVHRDIKPSNILIGDADWVLVADFGIARLAEDTARLTQTGMVIGTAEYVSPEQGEGTLQIDARSDIYSLGVVFYELLAGHAPFTATNPFSVIHKHLYEPVPPLPSVSPALWDVLTMALAKDPAQRFQNAAAFRAALASVIDTPSGERTSRPIVTQPGIQTIVDDAPPAAPQTGDAGSQPAARRPRHWLPWGIAASGVATLACAAIVLTNVAGQAAGPLLQTVRDRAVGDGTATVQAAANRTATSQAGGTETAIAGARLRAQGTATAAVARSLLVVETLQTTAQRVFGPVAGDLPHVDDTQVALRSANVSLINLVVEAVFFNPPPFEEAPWDYGFMVRSTDSNAQFRIFFRPDSPDGGAQVRFYAGNLNQRVDVVCASPPRSDPYPPGSQDEQPLGEDDPASSLNPNVKVTTMPIPSQAFDRSPGGSNRIRLVVRGRDMWILSNGRLLGVCDVNQKLVAGDVAIVSGFIAGDGKGSRPTRYTDFVVWSLP